jgi:hypothetical protein
LRRGCGENEALASEASQARQSKTSAPRVVSKNAAACSYLITELRDLLKGKELKLAFKLLASFEGAHKRAERFFARPRWNIPQHAIS